MPSSSLPLPFRLRFETALEALITWVAHGALPLLLSFSATVAGFVAGQWRAVDPTIAAAVFAAGLALSLIVLALHARTEIRLERSIDHRNDLALDLQRARFALLRLEREREDLDAKAARLEALVLSMIRVRQEHQRGSSGTTDEETLGRLFALLDGKAARR